MTPHSSLNFEAPLVEFAAALNLNFGIAVKRVSFDILTRIVERTPVDTGRARSAWDLTVGEPSSYVPPPLPPGAVGALVEDPASGLSVAITGESVIYVVNNLDYIEPLENGHSQQAPAGMVRITLAEVAAEIELYLEGMEP